MRSNDSRNVPTGISNPAKAHQITCSPKLHAAAYVIEHASGWYKIYYPKEFYADTYAAGGVELAL